MAFVWGGALSTTAPLLRQVVMMLLPSPRALYLTNILFEFVIYLFIYVLTYLHIYVYMYAVYARAHTHTRIHVFTLVFCVSICLCADTLTFGALRTSPKSPQRDFSRGGLRLAATLNLKPPNPPKPSNPQTLKPSNPQTLKPSNPQP